MTLCVIPPITVMNRVTVGSSMGDKGRELLLNSSICFIASTQIVSMRIKSWFRVMMT